jgi:hypothetical protein
MARDAGVAVSRHGDAPSRRRAGTPAPVASARGVAWPGGLVRWKGERRAPLALMAAAPRRRQVPARAAPRHLVPGRAAAAAAAGAAAIIRRGRLRGAAPGRAAGQRRTAARAARAARRAFAAGESAGRGGRDQL